MQEAVSSLREDAAIVHGFSVLALVAQLVERLAVNQVAAGSSPAQGAERLAPRGRI